MVKSHRVYSPETRAQSLGRQGAVAPHFNFLTKKGPTVSVPQIRDVSFHRCSNLRGPKISRFLLCMLQFLDNLRQLLIFFLPETKFSTFYIFFSNFHNKKWKYYITSRLSLTFTVFIEVRNMKAFNFIKKRIQHRCFPV